jgi:uncharacterized protein YbbC (DUF1343 family)
VFVVIFGVRVISMRFLLWWFVLLAPLIVGVVVCHAVEESPGRGQTMTGLDVLVRKDFEPLAGRRVGLITNHTGLSRDGISNVRWMMESEAVELVALFSPEHGFEGKLDVPRIEDSTDKQTGLKIHSLYGQTRRPTPEMLEGLDTIVFDIQDIGTRFYTYISTMGEAMQVAAEHGLRFVVLDRPNPLGGEIVAGPVLDDGLQSFVGFHTLAIQHGMTTGELARMLSAELEIDLDLEVISCEGWTRSMTYDQTGLMWVDPSPNMRSLTQAVLYPGVGLLETTNLSVGRGTDTPFEMVGAPWIGAQQWAAALNDAKLPGVTFVPRQFRPESSKFADEVCGGVTIMLTDWDQFDPMRTGLTMAVTLRRLYPDSWESDRYLRLLANRAVLQAVKSGEDPGEIIDSYQHELREFLDRRARYLIYR